MLALDGSLLKRN